MMILVSKDLFFVPTVKSAAEGCGMSFVVALNPDSKQVLEADASQVKICMVDLSSVSAKDIADVGESLSGRFPTARLVAFAPHVHVNKMESAAAAGFDPVLSRGQVSSQLPRLLAGWEE